MSSPPGRWTPSTSSDVRAVVRGWYTASTPEIGIAAVETPYGFLTSSDRSESRRLVLTEDAPERVAGALRAAADHFGDRDFDVWVDDRARAERLGAALQAVGWRPVQQTVILGLAGDIDTGGRSPEGLTIEVVDDVDALREWASVKLRGFADSEAPPAEAEIEAEVSVRRAEWPVASYHLARIGDEAAAILGHYTGGHQMVFLLTTRVPFRHRGIGRAMLAHWTRRGAAEAAHSLLINCDDGGPAAALYRRLGFTDEVYWYRRFRRDRHDLPTGR